MLRLGASLGFPIPNPYARLWAFSIALGGFMLVVGAYLGFLRLTGWELPIILIGPYLLLLYCPFLLASLSVFVGKGHPVPLLLAVGLLGWGCLLAWGAYQRIKSSMTDHPQQLFVVHIDTVEEYKWWALKNLYIPVILLLPVVIVIRLRWPNAFGVSRPTPAELDYKD
jgi:hypothetical protein